MTLTDLVHAWATVGACGATVDAASQHAEQLRLALADDAPAARLTDLVAAWEGRAADLRPVLDAARDRAEFMAATFAQPVPGARGARLAAQIVRAVRGVVRAARER